MSLKIKVPKIKQIVDRVYQLSFKNRFDLTMTFMRFQEYYESPKFRDKVFTFAEFMRWYSVKYGKGAFTYTKDWNGFNIPAVKIKELMDRLVEEQLIEDLTEYDLLMFGLIHKIKEKVGDWNFYLIGIHGDDVSTAKHEICHGMFWTNETYRKEATTLVKNLPKKARQNLEKVLKKRGYHPSVFVDEINAYMSTGLINKMNKKLLKRYRKDFKLLFRRYHK